MRERRFHVEDFAAGVVRVEGKEARHALRVLRLGVGAEIVLFDGRGGEARGRIESTSAESFDVKVLSMTTGEERSETGLVIATAVPKGPRADWLVEKCAELGVGELWPLLCGRSAVRPAEGKIERWRRKAVEAAKQAGRSRTLQIATLKTLDQALAAATGRRRMLFGDMHADAKSLVEMLADVAADQAVTVIFIGPEGGFTGAERTELERAGAVPFRLADAVLRVETAVIAAAAVWAAVVNEA